jgi:hypothetical protein
VVTETLTGAPIGTVALASTIMEAFLLSVPPKTYIDAVTELFK